jgi:hypothetical protein
MKNLIKKIILEQLNEVRYIKTGWNQFDKEKPIRDDEVIRVYHGFSSNAGFNEAFFAILHGLSGQERARRIYSYEYGNNPKGLFVSINFDVVKRNFAGSGVIIEFSTKVSDLEAPVWVGGRSYYVQGEYTQSFKDDEEREQQRLKNREREAASPYPQISQSDRPELAQTLFDNAERQALYIGDLNPNMIKYVWYNETLHKHNRTNGDWVRYTRKDFVNKFKDLYDDKYTVSARYSDYNKSSRMFKPNDDFNEDVFIKKLEDKYGEGTYERWLKYELDRKFDEYYLKNYFWPKQMKQAREFYLKKFPHLNV